MPRRVSRASGRVPSYARKARSALRRSTSPRSALTLALFDRFCEIPRRGGQLPERLRDGDDTHAGAGAAERLNGLVEPLPCVIGRERGAPRRVAKLLRRQPRRPGPPPEAVLFGVPVSGLLLRGRVRQRTQTTGVSGVGRGLRVFFD